MFKRMVRLCRSDQLLTAGQRSWMLDINHVTATAQSAFFYEMAQIIVIKIVVILSRNRRQSRTHKLYGNIYCYKRYA